MRCENWTPLYPTVAEKGLPLAGVAELGKETTYDECGKCGATCVLCYVPLPYNCDPERYDSGDRMPVCCRNAVVKMTHLHNVLPTSSRLQCFYLAVFQA